MELSNRIRWGLATLVLGSLLGMIALVLRGPVPLPQIEVTAWAQAVTSSNYFTAQVLYIIAYILPYFGFWGLYALLSKTESVEKIAFWGFMGCISGTALALPTLGIFSFVAPRLAGLYLLGATQLPEIITWVATGPPAMINLSGGTVYLVGTVLTGIAIWRSGVFQKWVGLAMALHGLLLVIGFSIFPVLVLSWMLLFLVGSGTLFEKLNQKQ